MKTSFEKVVKAWQKASEDLHIKIQAPFILTSKNKKIKFELLVKNFGNRHGTIIISGDDMTEFNTPGKYGYYCSALNPRKYGAYKRQHFIDTLNDWGYYGAKSKTPDWYSGQP